MAGGAAVRADGKRLGAREGAGGGIGRRRCKVGPGRDLLQHRRRQHRASCGIEHAVASIEHAEMQEGPKV